MATTLTLTNPISSDRAAALGLVPRDYLIGESITVSDTSASLLSKAGYGAVGTPTVVYGGMDPSIPAFIRQTSGTYPTRNSVTLDPNRPVIWIGTTAPTVGSGYAISGVDLWIQG